MKKILSALAVPFAIFIGHAIWNHYDGPRGLDQRLANLRDRRKFIKDSQVEKKT
jgi:hypothetical protein